MNSTDNNLLNRTEENTEPRILVSVVVPIYNAYDYLQVALESILAQTLTDIEVICIDDGSTDRSLDIIKKFRETDNRIRVVTENNAGVSTARNKGIARVRGEYTIFLDADDFYEPTLLEKLYKLLKGLFIVAIALLGELSAARAESRGGSPFKLFVVLAIFKNFVETDDIFSQKAVDTVFHSVDPVNCRRSHSPENHSCQGGVYRCRGASRLTYYCVTL